MNNKLVALKKIEKSAVDERLLPYAWVNKLCKTQEEAKIIQQLIQHYINNFGKPDKYIEQCLLKLIKNCNNNPETLKTAQKLILDYAKRMGNPFVYVENWLLPLLKKNTVEIQQAVIIDKTFKTINQSYINKFGNKYFELRTLMSTLAESCLNNTETIKTARTLVENYTQDFGNPHKFIKNELTNILKNDIKEVRQSLKAWNKYKETHKNNITEEYLTILINPETAKADFQEMIQQFKWNDELKGWFSQGAEYFGYNNMKLYIGQSDRQDALHFIPKLIDFVEGTKLDKKRFTNNILLQVPKATDQENTENNMYQRLGILIDQLSIDWDKKEREYKVEIIEYNELRTKLLSIDTQQKIPVCYTKLKFFLKILDLLKFPQMKKLQFSIEELKLKGYKGNKAHGALVANYFTQLFMHPEVDMDIIKDFFENTAEFLTRGDSHSPVVLHNAIKPSNYLEFPFIDITPEELRNALPLGHIDALSPFKPFKKEFFAVLENTTLLNKASNNYQKLFLEAVIKTCYQETNTDKDYLSNLENRKEQYRNISGKLTDNLNTRNKILVTFKALLNERLVDHDFQKKFKKKMGLKELGVIYTAEVLARKDPRCAVTGNDTICCMSIGAGMNNVYLYNPNCGFFIINVRQDGEKKPRTILQSVLTLDKDIQSSAAILIDKINSQSELGELNFTRLLPSSFLKLMSQPSIIAADNIEAYKNFSEKMQTDEAMSKFIEIIYQQFFKEYSSTQFTDVKTEKLLVGLHLSDYLNNIKKIANNYLPVVPLGYTDKKDEQCGVVKLNEENRAKKTPQRVKELDIDNVLAMAYLKDKNGTSKKTNYNFATLENELIASRINNVVKERNNLSFGVYDEEGCLAGFILAYKGKNKETGEECIYLSELVIDPDQKNKGVKEELLKVFNNAVKNNYNDLPIISGLL